MYSNATAEKTTADDTTFAPGLGPGKETLISRLYGSGMAQPGQTAMTTAHTTLRVGSTGPAVVELQQKLGVAADGQFGPKTRAAVVAFQQSHGLAADGIVGAQTWAALDGTAPAQPQAQTPAPTPAQPQAPAQTPSQTPAQTPAQPQAQPEAPVADKPATASGARQAIVDAARGKIGSVFSDVAAAADETGDKTRQGWETLTEIFNVAFPSFPKKIIKYIKYGKNNGGPNSSPNGLVSWCGIFATWAVMTGGGNCGTWDGGPRCSSMSKQTKDPKPGDVGYFTANAHHCIIAQVDGDKIETIDGNSYDGASGGNGAITSRWRSRSEFAAFFKQVDD